MAFFFFFFFFKKGNKDPQKTGGGGLVAKSYLSFATPWTVAHQAPLSMGFPRQEYWNGQPFHSVN